MVVRWGNNDDVNENDYDDDDVEEEEEDEKEKREEEEAVSSCNVIDYKFPRLTLILLNVM